MMSFRALILLAFVSLTPGVCRGQTGVPDHLPELKYPPIAKAAHVQGDVVVNFRQTAEGGTTDVKAVSGPPMLQGVAVENVKAWHFPATTENTEQVHRVTFRFQFEGGGDYDNEQATKAELDGAGGVRVISILTTGLQRSGCPSAEERVLPSSIIDDDFVELRRWNEVVRVTADGKVTWEEREQRGPVHYGHIERPVATALLERFRTPIVWGLCNNYDQAGLMDGGSSSFKVRIGGRDKSVREYGDAAPPIFGQVEDAIDAAVNTHQWRHGDPTKESIVEISYEYLPKPGKTKLMDSAYGADKTAIRAALAAGEKLTDVDASGWTPLMYAAGSYGNSAVSELLKQGAQVNARSERGETALMASAITGDVDEYLLRAGADVNAANDVGTTALMLLAQRGRPDQVDILLKAGADARNRDSLGRSALDYLNAAFCGRPIVKKVDPPGMMEAVITNSRCNFRGADYQKSKRLLTKAGAKTAHHTN